MQRISAFSNGGTEFWFRDNRRYARARRALDVAVSLLALTVASPVIVASMLAIVLESSGSPVFRQRRVGRFGKMFTLYKLRTMHREHCGDALSPTKSTDSRVTQVGKILRKLSFDELPQFVNVLRGEMTLVGPRPEMPFLVRKYAPWQQLRHLVTPGLTGLWQVECRSSIPLHMPEATMLDLKYIRTSSTFTDGLIILRTIRAIVYPYEAY